MTTPPQSARRVEQARARFARVPFAKHLGVAVADLGPDRAELILPYHPEHMNAVGVLNGGASVSLLTMAGTVAAWTGVDLESAGHQSCVDVAIQYLAPAREEDVLAEARVVRRGRDLAFVTVALRSRAGHSVGQGLLTYQAPDHAGRPPRVLTRPALLPVPELLTPPGEQRLFRGYVQKLGMRPLHESAGRVRLHMPGTPMHLDEAGRVHAGALASIVDIAAVAASWSLVPRRPGARGSTIAMQVGYPAAASGAVVADAHVQQRSEALLFSTVHVTAADTGQLVAMGQVSYRLLEPWPSPTREDRHDDL
jgi:uncharacterized protein (TIGR00369 family)